MSKLQPNNIAKFKQQMNKPVARLQRTVIDRIARSYDAVEFRFVGPDFVYTAYGTHKDYRRFSLRK